MKKLILSLGLSLLASSAVASEDKDTFTNPVTELKAGEQKFAAAKFGQQVAAMAFSYVKDVREIDDKRIIDVVIVDKLCHVTVIEHNNRFQAEKIACDEGKYFKN